LEVSAEILYLHIIGSHLTASTFEHSVTMFPNCLNDVKRLVH